LTLRVWGAEYCPTSSTKIGSLEVVRWQRNGRQIPIAVIIAAFGEQKAQAGGRLLRSSTLGRVNQIAGYRLFS
jgi:hypothetical protein